LNVNGGTANLGNTQLSSGNDISVAGWTLNNTGTLDATATNNLTATNSQIAAGDTNLTAKNGNLTVSGGTANLGNTQLSSGNNLSVAGLALKAGTLGMTADNNLSVSNSRIVAGDTNMTATRGDLNIAGTTVDLANAWLKSGNNISIVNSPQFDVRGNLGIAAANRLTVTNVVGRIGGVAGNNGIAEFDALGFHLFDWHFYTKTVLLACIDIYNDPIYWNSLTYDRIIRTINDGFWLSMNDDQDEDELEELIDGSWLPEEKTLEALDGLWQFGKPVARASFGSGMIGGLEIPNLAHLLLTF
jgi:hypothetical protein